MRRFFCFLILLLAACIAMVFYVARTKAWSFERLNSDGTNVSGSEPARRTVLYRLVKDGRPVFQHEYAISSREISFPEVGSNITVDYGRIGPDIPVIKNWSSPESLHALRDIYQPTCNSEEKKLYLLNYQTVLNAFIRNNISYFVYAGTLLGAYRNHGMNGWDFDMDVMVSEVDRENVYRALTNISGFKMLKDGNCLTRCYVDHVSTLKGLNYNWPYVDIYYFVEKNGKIWDCATGCKGKVCFKKETVFPLVYRPFEKSLLPAPCDSEQMLVAMYGDIRDCVSSGTRNKFTKSNRAGTQKWMHNRIACKKLNAIHPYVLRWSASETPNGTKFIIEELKHGNKTIRKVKVKTCN